MDWRRAVRWSAVGAALASAGYLGLAAGVFFSARGWRRPAPSYELRGGCVWQVWGGERPRFRGAFEQLVDTALSPGTGVVEAMTRRRCDDPRVAAAFARCLAYAGLRDDGAITAVADEALDSIEVTLADGRTWCFVPDGPSESERPIDRGSLGSTGPR